MYLIYLLHTPYYAAVLVLEMLLPIALSWHVLQFLHITSHILGQLGVNFQSETNKMPLHCPSSILSENLNCMSPSTLTVANRPEI